MSAFEESLENGVGIDLHQHPTTKAVKNHVFVTTYWYVCKTDTAVNKRMKKTAAPRFGSYWNNLKSTVSSAMMSRSEAKGVEDRYMIAARRMIIRLHPVARYRTLRTTIRFRIAFGAIR